jgi:hypothetical protein
VYGATGTLFPVPGPPIPITPVALANRLRWALGLVAQYGGPGARSTGDPVFAELDALTTVLRETCRSGSPEELLSAVVLADVLGAAWERQGELAHARERLSELLAALEKAGCPTEAGTARVLRRRARIAMKAGDETAAETDLAAARAAAGSDESLVLSVLLDECDLAMHRGDWAAAAALVPEVFRRADETGDPLRRAMVRNRAGWAALGRSDLVLAKQRYEEAWALAEEHGDAVVASRTAAGVALVATLNGDLATGRAGWVSALSRAEALHDTSFALHCLDGIAGLLALSGQEKKAWQLSRSVTRARAELGYPREVAVIGLEDIVKQRVRRMLGEVDPPALWTFDEAVAAARQLVAPA